MRHTAASHAIAAGEYAEEVSWQLGHRNSVVTRTVYVHELKTAERSARRRQRWKLSLRMRDMLGRPELLASNRSSDLWIVKDVLGWAPDPQPRRIIAVSRRERRC